MMLQTVTLCWFLVAVASAPSSSKSNGYFDLNIVEHGTDFTEKVDAERNMEIEASSHSKLMGVKYIHDFNRNLTMRLTTGSEHCFLQDLARAIQDGYAVQPRELLVSLRHANDHPQENGVTIVVNDGEIGDRVWEEDVSLSPEMRRLCFGRAIYWLQHMDDSVFVGSHQHNGSRLIRHRRQSNPINSACNANNIWYRCKHRVYGTNIEAKLCPFIFEEGRQACGAYIESDCESLGCCWDPEATDAGRRCYQRECLPGRFGWGCRFQCHCQEGDSCDQLSGHCTLGCPSQKWGVGCLLDSACTYNDKYGTSYMGRMYTNQGGHACATWTLQYAYTDSNFPDGKRSLAKYYCRNPLPQEKNTWCYYYIFGMIRCWDYCVLGKCACPHGRFDINCALECHCSDPEEQCNWETGSCHSGCDDHWTGSNCQECDDGYFGHNCEYSCNCATTGEVCDKQNGTCATGCREGYSGPGCQIAFRLVSNAGCIYYETCRPPQGRFRGLPCSSRDTLHNRDAIECCRECCLNQAQADDFHKFCDAINDFNCYFD